jgi:hypothetical protein
MIFFFFVKIGPNNSKFGKLNSRSRHNDNQLHQIRIQSLSFTTVPFESSYSGKFLSTTGEFSTIPRIDIEMSNNFSTKSTSSSSSQGLKRNLLMSQSSGHSTQDSNKKTAKVVMRTGGQGIPLASFQVGSDDSHGVAITRNSSGDSTKSTKLFSIFSQSKQILGANSSLSVAASPMSSDKMRTTGQGSPLASFQAGLDDSHGVATSILNSGVFPSPSASLHLPYSQTEQFLGQRSIDFANRGDATTPQHEALFLPQHLLSNEAMSLKDNSTSVA